MPDFFSLFTNRYYSYCWQHFTDCLLCSKIFPSMSLHVMLCDMNASWLPVGFTYHLIFSMIHCCLFFPVPHWIPTTWPLSHHYPKCTYIMSMAMHGHCLPLYASLDPFPCSEAVSHENLLEKRRLLFMQYLFNFKQERHAKRETDSKSHLR